MQVKSENEMMGAMVLGYRYIVKNAEEYYYLEYSHIPPGNPLMTMIIGLVMLKVQNLHLANIPIVQWLKFMKKNN